MSLLRLQHVALPFPGGDVATTDARRFYVETLGLRELPVADVMRATGVMWFAAGESEIHLFPEPSGVAVNAESRRHPCVQVDDLDAYRERLTAAGVDTITAEPQIAERPRFFVIDPFGNALEFTQMEAG
jgi:extradiol dioxygenase family protein